MSRSLYLTICLLVICLALVGCGTDSYATRAVASPSAPTSPLPTATFLPTQPPTPAPLPSATSTSTALPPAAQMLFLSSNDNWGETEPCG
jgi:hypothetical protein